jgi:hypothetical protein
LQEIYLSGEVIEAEISALYKIKVLRGEKRKISK